MLRKIMNKLLGGRAQSPLDRYYENLLRRGADGAPLYREAQRDYRVALKSRYPWYM